ncbi:MAG: GTP cyclohydrolase FolE2 [Pontibacterium sp.]
MNSLNKQPVDLAHNSTAQQQGTIDLVGMSGIALPIMLAESTLGDVHCKAHVHSFVDLAVAKAKGIHMSRLYLLLQESFGDQSLTPTRLALLLEAQVASQQTLSTQAQVRFDFDFYTKRAALKSENQGWKSYPTSIVAKQTQQGFTLDLTLKVPYSSTCPCSAALSRQRLADAFTADFANTPSPSKETITTWLSNNGSIATPHSQRSWATIKLRLDSLNLESFPLIHLINHVEEVLGTPVQTAVKRADEQAFAELNGSNLMFCEDAVRRITSALELLVYVQDYWIKVEHLESLHAHDAVAINTKGISGGFTPSLFSD